MSLVLTNNLSSLAFVKGQLLATVLESLNDMTGVVQFSHQMLKFPSEFPFPTMFFAHLKKCNSDIALRKQFGIWYIVNYTYISFQVRGIHHQAEKFKSFRSNNVNLITTIGFLHVNKILFSNPHEPFSQPDKKTTTVKTTILVF